MNLLTNWYYWTYNRTVLIEYNIIMAMQKRQYNSKYESENLTKVAFLLGGIGAGMICLEGCGALSHVSLRHHPDMLNEP